MGTLRLLPLPLQNPILQIMKPRGKKFSIFLGENMGINMFDFEKFQVLKWVPVDISHILAEIIYIFTLTLRNFSVFFQKQTC